MAGDFFDTIFGFLDQGGHVLWVILAVTFILWVLIIERFYFLKVVFPKLAKTMIDSWQPGNLPSHWHMEKIRSLKISELRTELKQGIDLIKSIVALTPMLGLLGTVTGMIAVFDVMAMLGTGNARMMASGISMATIPTMAGMVAAISGLYFSSRLEGQVQAAIEKLADELPYEHVGCEG